MNELIKNIEEQIKNCKKLLSVFQGERQLYKDKKQIGVKEVMEIMERKKQILEAFEAQRDFIRKMEGECENSRPELKEKKKALIRELAGTLEQLLVIDRENEKLLRDIMSSKNQPVSERGMSSVSRQRPSLQRQLPLIPGANTAPASNPLFSKIQAPEKQAARETPVKAQPGPASEQPEKSREANDDVFKYKPKSCLREYAGTAQLLKFASKYA